MRVVNRTAVTITGARPYIDWMRRPTPTSVLQLETLRAWFRVDIHSVVVDVGDDDIEGVEL